jgi:acyl carrier protein
MTRAQTVERVMEILVDQLGIDINDMTEDSEILNDLGADSLDIAELLCTVEEEWDIEIDDEEIRSVITISQLVDYIEQQN